jgi:branched-chain amino acid transport system substrate-binding protein
MPKVRNGYPFLCLLLLLTVLACDQRRPESRCTDSIGCVTIGPTESIKIGVLQALSGKVAPLGIEQIRGLELALEKRHGKAAGHAVILQKEDTGCTAEGGANSALKIVADPKSIAIFGTTCSGAAATAAKVMADAGLTMISGNNSAPFLTAIGGKRAPSWQPGYFRTAPNEENAGKAAATYAYTKLGVRRAAVVNDGDIYTRGLTDGFVRVFSQLGGTVVLDASINKGDKEMQPVLTAVVASQTELLFFPLFQPEGNHILEQAKQDGRLANLTLMSDGALIESSFLAAVGDLARGMYFVGPSIATTTRSKELAQAYQQKFKVAPATSYYQSAFDAAELLFQAIERIAIHRPDGSLVIGREALRRQLYDTKSFDGVTGSLTCDQFGDCALPRFNVLRLDNPLDGVDGLQQNIQFTFAPLPAKAPTENGGK